MPTPKLTLSSWASTVEFETLFMGTLAGHQTRGRLTCHGWVCYRTETSVSTA